jgi:hypothetical protein
MDKLKGISNENKLNEIEQSVYDKFNNFIFSDDLKLTGKLLHRFEHFLNVKDLPGDIVEVGVFKGSGISTFIKFVEIYCPNSNKKVIGFDIFNPIEAKQVLEKDGDIDKDSMFVVYDRVDYEDLTLESVTNRLNQTKISSDKFKLIKGDVQYSIPKFLEENQGFRVSLLYIDVDLDRPTYHTLINLWDRILPGGVILFDEYEYHKFTESTGVERFLKEKNIDYNLNLQNHLHQIYHIELQFSLIDS